MQLPLLNLDLVGAAGCTLNPVGAARSGTLPNNTGMFPQLRAFNGSHNAFSGPLPAALGQSGIFRLSPLQFVNGEILMHVLDLSFNQLNGSLPSFLDSTSVPAQYVQKGIFLQARGAAR